jgi:N-acetylneuraminate synthase/N,N'-diacetyllegionaminate synthase
MVNAIRNIEQALGSGTKEPSPSELPNRLIARKSIHIRHAMKCGLPIEANDLIMLRPGDGISPMRVNDIVGRKLNADLPEGHKLREEDLS